MSMFELEKGIATILQTEEYFDCYPAIKAAFGFTKAFFKLGKEGGEEGEEEGTNEEGETDEDASLEYKEFGIFLHALKQYYLYCKVNVIQNS